MTISYGDSNIVVLLCKWRGSLWRTVSKDLVVFLLLYFAISAWYRWGMTSGEQETFEKLAVIFDTYTKNLPLTFLLGFYITTIVNRWWQQFEHIAWPDKCMTWVNVAFKDRKDRHQIARYLCLTCALAWREISEKIRARFPNMKQIIHSGLMTNKEYELIKHTTCTTVRYNLPTQWIINKIRIANASGEIRDNIGKPLIEEVNDFAESFRRLLCYDWVSVPLVYTQVSALATYGFFALCLIGRQFLNGDKKIEGFEVDFVFPIFTVMQFLFFVGWFKVGQELIRPFGEDDEDFELNYLLDRHVEAVFTIASEVYDQNPEFEEDKFWNNPLLPLPHTKVSAKMKTYPPKLHATVSVVDEEDDEDKLAEVKTEVLRQGAIMGFKRNAKVNPIRGF